MTIPFPLKNHNFLEGAIAGTLH